MFLILGVRQYKRNREGAKSAKADAKEYKINLTAKTLRRQGGVEISKWG
jgi:hypothetical protein